MSFFKSLLKIGGGVAGFALGGPAGALAGYGLGSAIGGSGKKPARQGVSPLDQAATDAGTRSTAMEDSYLQRANSFDPQASVNQYAQGAYAAMKPQLDQSLLSLKGQSVGAGRFDSGLFDQDSGQVVQNAQANLNAQIAQQSLSAAGLQQQNIGQLGSFAANERNNYLDLLAGNADRQTADANAKRAGKTSTWGALLGAAGTLGGAYLGGKGK